jgi:excisionase family DNA binding protein
MSMMKGKLTTSETAKAVGLHLVTLQRWIAAGKLKAPTPVLIGAVGYRLWTAKDVEGLKRTKKQIYSKGRGRKPRPS